jgi:hypothetical protein
MNQKSINTNDHEAVVPQATQAISGLHRRSAAVVPDTDDKNDTINTTVIACHDNPRFDELLKYMIMTIENGDLFDNFFKRVFLRSYSRYVFGRTPVHFNKCRGRINTPTGIHEIMLLGSFTPGQSHILIPKILSWMEITYSPRRLNMIINAFYVATAQEMATVNAYNLQPQGLSVPHSFNEEQFNQVMGFLKTHIPSTLQQQRMTNKLANSVDGFTNIGESLMDIMSELTSSGSAKAVEKLPESINKAADAIESIKDAIIIAGLGYVAYKVYSDPSKKNIVVAVLYVSGIVAVKGMECLGEFLKKCKQVVINCIVSVFKAFSSKENDLKPQGFDDLSTFFTFFNNWPSSFISKLTSICRLAKDLPEFLSNVFDFLKTYINKFTNNYFDLDTKERSLNRLDLLNPIFESIDKDYNSGVFTLNSLNYTKVCGLLSDYESVFMKSSNGRANMALFKMLEHKIRTIKQIKKDFERFGFSDVLERQEPVVVAFMGAPGTKKTALMNQVRTIIVHSYFPEQEVRDMGMNNLVYNRNSTDDYWSGYPRTCFASSHDDWGKDRDTVNSPNRDFTELIQIRNTADFTLNMADLESKGTVKYNAKWTFISTNLDLTTFEPVSLHDRNAFKRRFDVLVTPQFKDDETREKYSTAQAVDIDPEDYLYNCKIPKVRSRKGADGVEVYYVTKEYTFVQFMKHIQESYAQKKAYHEANISRHKKNIEMLKSKYAAERDQDLPFDLSDDVKANLDAVYNDLFAQAPSDEEFADCEEGIYTEEQVSPNINETHTAPVSEAAKHFLDTAFPRVKSPFDDYFTDFPTDAEFDLPTPRDIHAVDDEVAMLADFADLIGRIYNTKTTNERYTHIRAFEDMFGEFQILPDEECKAIIHLLNDEKLYKVYAVMYNIFTRTYGPLPYSRVPIQCHGMHKFVAFVTMCAHDIRYGEYMFRGYPYEVRFANLHEIDVKFTVPVSKRILQTLNTLRYKYVDWIAKQPPMVKLACSFVIGYTTAKAVQKSISGLITLCKLAINLIVDYIWPNEEQSIGAKQFHSGPKITRTSMSALRNKMTAQGADVSAGKQYESLLDSNLAEMYAEDDDSETFVGNVLFLDSEHIIIPQHYFHNIQQKYKINGEDMESSCMIRFQKKKYKAKDDEDVTIIKTMTSTEFIQCTEDFPFPDTHLLMCKISQKVRTFKDILPCFVQDKDIAIISNRDSTISMAVRSDDFRISSSTVTIAQLAHKELRLAKALYYCIDTGSGDCGVPIYIRNRLLQKRRLAGVHVFGHPKGSLVLEGVATLITQEMLTMAKTECARLIEELEKLSLEEQGAKLSHSPYAISKLKLSVLATRSDALPPPTKVPSKTMPNKETGQDPYVKALANYYIRDTDIDERVMRVAKDDMNSFLCSKSWKPHCEVLTFDTAVYGDPNNDLLKSIPRNTSAGFPWKYEYRGIKQELLAEDAKRDKTNPAYAILTEMCADSDIALSKGIRNIYIYTDNIKDALTTKAKAESYDSRLFCGVPIDLVIQQKRYFGAFVEFYIHNSLDRGNAVVVNPCSHDWNSLSRKLSAFSTSFEETEVLAMDYSKFDASQTTEMLWHVFDVIESWYQYHGMTECSVHRKTLYYEIVNSKHIALTNITEWRSSLPSGTWLTIVINCITNSLAVRYTYYSLVPFARNFAQYNYLCVLGDDLILSICEEHKKFWTSEAITATMKRLGFKVTSDDKLDPEIKFKPLTQATFLKRSFRKDGVNVLAPLSMETIMNTPLWSKEGEYYRKTTYDTIKFFFRELSLHPKEEWDKRAPMMRKAIRDAQLEDVEGLCDHQLTWRNSVLTGDTFTLDFW